MGMALIYNINIPIIMRAVTGLVHPPRLDLPICILCWEGHTMAAPNPSTLPDFINLAPNLVIETAADSKVVRLKRRRRSKPITERFWPKVDRSGGPDACWTWTAGRDDYGYGWFYTTDGKRRRSHIVSFEMVHGPVPRGLLVCHSCDNPPCVNPTHLWLGTYQDNLRDAAHKGRCRNLPKPGEENPAAKLKSSQVIEIRKRLKAGERLVVLAEEYGVSKSLISAIKNRHNWKCLPESTP
jgi:hypothetical protein